MGSTVTVQGLCVTAGAATLVDNLNFTIQPGEVLALIGESGSGKTTTALALMGHARRGCRIAEGVIRIGDVDVRKLAPAQLRSMRGRTVSYIAQSAAASFNPSRTILDQVVEPALLHGTLPRGQAELKAIALFRELALPDPETIGQRSVPRPTRSSRALPRRRASAAVSPQSCPKYTSSSSPVR